MQDRFKFRSWHEPTKTMEYNGLWTGRDWDKKLSDCNFKLMQCTGLKDKNGKLIYEGDIVKFAEYDWTDFCFKDWEQETTEIIWGGGHSYPAFDLKTHDFDCNGLAYIFGEGWTIEVIGNIYENPELLEVENERN